jgi:hypothetical protein
MMRFSGFASIFMIILFLGCNQQVPAEKTGIHGEAPAPELAESPPDDLPVSQLKTKEAALAPAPVMAPGNDLAGEQTPDELVVVPPEVAGKAANVEQPQKLARQINSLRPAKPRAPSVTKATGVFLSDDDKVRIEKLRREKVYEIYRMGAEGKQEDRERLYGIVADSREENHIRASAIRSLNTISKDEALIPLLKTIAVDAPISISS